MVILLVGTGEPRHIATKTPLEKLNQNLGLADPPPQLGQKTKFFDRFNLKAPLILPKQDSIVTMIKNVNNKPALVGALLVLYSVDIRHF